MRFDSFAFYFQAASTQLDRRPPADWTTNPSVRNPLHRHGYTQSAYIPLPPSVQTPPRARNQSNSPRQNPQLQREIGNIALRLWDIEFLVISLIGE